MSEMDLPTLVHKNLTKIVQLYYCSHEYMDSKPEIFEKILGKDFDLAYKVQNSNHIFDKDEVVGKTTFQLINAMSFDLCKILINHGADFTVTDKKGSTVLHRVSCIEYKYYVNSLKSYNVNRVESYSNMIMSAHVNLKNPKNPIHKNGLTHYHVACMYNRADAAKLFLDNGVSVNETINRESKFYPGYSALHFAAKSCAVEVVKLLLRSGADIFAKDLEGMTPLHVLMIERKKTFVTLNRLERIASFKGEQYCYPYTKKYYNNNEKIVYLLLERIKICDFNLDDTGMSYFHVLCFLGDTCAVNHILDKDEKVLSQSVNMNSPIWAGYTALHFAAHSNIETIKLLVRKGANLVAMDAKGITPFDICMREFSIADVHQILLLQPAYSKIVFSDGKTNLSEFIHAMPKHNIFEDFLKNNLTSPNMFIPYDSPICAGYTPLHLAVICTERPLDFSSSSNNKPEDLFTDLKSLEFMKYLARIDLCLAYNPDVTNRDATGSTPIHWAFKLKQSQAVRHLLMQHQSNSDYIDLGGLSHLHIACAAKNEMIVKKLLCGGANVNEVAKSKQTWLDDTLCHTARYQNQVITCFIDKESTPLHFATSVKCVKIVQMLIDHGTDLLAKDANNLNPLERILEVSIFQDKECPKRERYTSFDPDEMEIIKILVRKIGDKLADTKPNQMLFCYTLLEGDLLAGILSYSDESAMKVLASVRITALHVACFTRNLLQVNQLVNEIDVNSHVDLDSPLWPGNTPLHVFIKHRWMDPLETSDVNKAILKLLLQRGADVAALNAKSETPIHVLFSQHNYYSNKLLQNLKDFCVNPANKKGYTHLHIASACGAATVVKKLLEHRAIIDQQTDYFGKDYGGFTALHFAAAFQQKDVVDVLLKHGANVNMRNARGGNSLHTANRENRQPCLELLQTLMCAGADIHARNIYGETPLELLIKSSNRTVKEIELFLDHGCRINIVNPITENGLLAVALNKSNRLPIFDIICRAFDLKDIDDTERNAIHHAVSFRRPDWSIFEIWTIDEKYTPSNDYIKGIASLIKLGLNVDHQDTRGLTPLHVAAQMQNLTGIVGLLKNGADINTTDDDGKPAFAYSLELARLYDEPMELDLRILVVITTHIYKLNMVRIGISKLNKDVDLKMCEIQLSDTVTRVELDQFNNEVERMKDEKIGSTCVTLYDFLFDTGAVTAFPYMLVDKRVMIDSIFKNEIESIREKFPEFTGILLLQYKKALLRCEILDSAESSLNFLVGFNIPAICSRVILRFLSNDDLNNIIDSV